MWYKFTFTVAKYIYLLHDNFWTFIRKWVLLISQEFKLPSQDPRYYAILSSRSILIHLRHCWIPDSRDLIASCHAKKARSALSPRGRRDGTPYAEDASASGLGALFLCPLIIIIHLLLVFPRSSLLCPPADLLFVFYFCSLCHTVVHLAHLISRITATPSRRPGRLSSMKDGYGSAGNRRDKRKRNKETIYRCTILVNHDGVHIANAFSDELPPRQPTWPSHVRNSRSDRGADGCRATAVGGAFGRAYFPDVSANDGISWHRPPPPTSRMTTTTRGWSFPP